MVDWREPFYAVFAVICFFVSWSYASSGNVLAALFFTALVGIFAFGWGTRVTLRRVNKALKPKDLAVVEARRDSNPPPPSPPAGAQ
jgi:hypothetical protein